MVEFWDVRSGKLLRTSRAHKNGSPGFAFSPQGNILATHSTDGIVKLWSVPDGQLLATLSDLREAVMWAAFSPDGKTLATAGAEGWLKLWHVATQRELATFKYDSVAWFTRFSPDGRVERRREHD